ncbi:hypothetical protein DENSPDRAFT_109862 [Dentipellis sp. KUC8613]|nr:hypothetical protein DENSPDRAFT_109862 [Dentipellis sp. KUC8613]
MMSMCMSFVSRQRPLPCHLIYRPPFAVLVVFIMVIMDRTPSRSSRHYYVGVGTIVLKVDDKFIRVHRYFLEEYSTFFRDLLSHSPEGEGQAGTCDENPVVINEFRVSSLSFELLMDVFYEPYVECLPITSLAYAYLLLSQNIHSFCSLNIAILFDAARAFDIYLDHIRKNIWSAELRPSDSEEDVKTVEERGYLFLPSSYSEPEKACLREIRASTCGPVMCRLIERSECPSCWELRRMSRSSDVLSGILRGREEVARRRRNVLPISLRVRRIVAEALHVDSI